MSAISTHEDFSRKEEVKRSSDRSFGVVFTIFFAVVGLWPLRSHLPVRMWALVLAALFMSVALLRPKWLRPLNHIWTMTGLLLGRVVNPVILALMLYVVITPIGLLFRLLRKDPLRLTADAGARTYWIERQPAGPAPDTMSRQF